MNIGGLGMSLKRFKIPISSIIVAWLLIVTMWIGIIIIIPDELEGAGSTDHSGTSTKSETWGIGGNPHRITGDYTISSNHIISVDPGVVIEFQGDYRIIVNGMFYANGTSSSRVNITYKAPWASTSAWKQISFNPRSGGALRYCDISRGGNDQSFPTIYLNTNSKVTVENCRINHSGRYGVYIQQGNHSIKNNIINHGSTSIYINQGNPEIINNILNPRELYPRGIDIQITAGSPNIFSNTINLNRKLGSGISILGGSPNIWKNTFKNCFDTCIRVIGGSANICGNNLLNSNFGVYIINSTSNFIFSDNIIKNCYIGIYSIKSAIIENCTIINSSVENFRLITNPIVYSINTSYDDSNKIDESAQLHKQWYLHTHVKTNFGSGIYGATVKITDSISTSQSIYATDSNGWVKWFRCTEKIFYKNTTTYKTPYNILASKPGFKSTSAAINISQSETVSLILKDIMKPDSYLNCSDIWFNSPSTIIDFQATDNLELKNISFYYIYSENNKTFNKPVKMEVKNIDGTTASGAFTFKFNKGNGFYNLYTIAADKTNNVETYTANDLEIGYDSELPNIENILSTEINEDSNTSCRIYVTVSDTLSGISEPPQIRYKYDLTKSSWFTNFMNMKQESSTSRSSRQYSYYYDIPKPPESWDYYQGKYIVWELKVRDRAGNEVISTINSDTMKYIDFIDHEPLITLLTPLEDNWYDGAVVIDTKINDNLDLGDPNHGVAEMEVQFSLDSTNGVDGEWNNCQNSPKTEEPFKILWQTKSLVTTHNSVWLRVRAKDNSGLYSNWLARRIKVDNEPGITNTKQMSGWYNSDVRIELNASDENGSGIKNIFYILNDIKLQNVNEHGLPIITTEGTNNILEYWSVDNQDNEEPHKFLFDIKLDKSGPFIYAFKSNYLSEEPENGTKFWFSVNITDHLSGLKSEPKFRIKFPGEQNFSSWICMKHIVSDQFRAEYSLLNDTLWSELIGGNVVIQILAIDNVENEKVLEFVKIFEELLTTIPLIKHTPVTVAFTGKDINITAEIIDNESISQVILFYRTSETTAFKAVAMIQNSENRIYYGKIPSQLSEGSVFYYIHTLDNENNSGTAPILNPETNPYKISIIIQDRDNDKLPDWWEVKYGLDPLNDTEKNGGEGDYDGDGFSNYDEFKADTSPIDKDDHPSKRSSGTSDFEKTILILVISVIIIILILVFQFLNKRASGDVVDEIDPEIDNEFNEKSISEDNFKDKVLGTLVVKKNRLAIDPEVLAAFEESEGKAIKKPSKKDKKDKGELKGKKKISKPETKGIQKSLKKLAIKTKFEKPILHSMDKIVKCNICLGNIKVGLNIITCRCGKKYHEECGKRVGICPSCEADLKNPEIKLKKKDAEEKENDE
jgi:hypothetical protein